MYKLNNKVLVIGTSFTHNDILYPRNWLQKSTEAEKTAIGIVWEDDPVLADDRYYWNGNLDTPKALDDVYHVWTQDEADDHLLPAGKSVGDPKYVQVWDANANNGKGGMVDGTERLVSRGLKHTMIAQVKDTAGKMLASTDWYITRKVERNVDIPADITAKRAAIVAESERLETAIQSCSTVMLLKEIMESQNWSN